MNNQHTFGFSHEDSFFSPFYSHLLDNHDHHEFLFSTTLTYQTPPPPPPPIMEEPEAPEEQTPPEKRKQKAVLDGPKGPNRRVGKKDRHSKIYTAQGPRDRRMRLSLQIARKFFDLQDMLGFDKASKTIEWLFNKSKAAIKDLSDNNNSPSEDNINNNDNGGGDDDGGGGGAGSRSKESRAKAREWARKRTKEKLMMKTPNNPKIRVNDDEQHQQSQIKVPLLEDQMASIDIINSFHQQQQMMIRYNDNGGFMDDLLPENWGAQNVRANNLGYGGGECNNNGLIQNGENPEYMNY